MTRAALIAGLTVTVTAACTYVVLRPAHASPQHVSSTSCGRPSRPSHYIGVITTGPPGGTELTSFARATGIHPSLVAYFTSFGARWNPKPACRILKTGALPVIQINPRHVPIAEIASGRFDENLERYAQHVRAFGWPVAISFGHEMNGYWYSWGYRHASPAVFVAAWRHIVTVFREQGADNVTWMWTVNIVDKHGGIPSPAPWWPGSAYVNWVGIDGYYLKPSWTFASLFGPTIKAVRALTLDPVLISETAASPAAGQPAKIADLFAGIRAYGLLGVVWFDVDKKQDWRIISPAAGAAFARGARTFMRPAS
jgi:hypothetical protein